MNVLFVAEFEQSPIRPTMIRKKHGSGKTIGDSE